jgi:hypothetical protein
MHFGSPSSQGVGQQVAERAERRQLATSFALASVDEHPVMIEQRSVADGPATSTLNQATKQQCTPAGNRSEQSVTAEVMAPTDISAKVSEQLADARRRPPARATASLAVPQTAMAATEESHPSASARATSRANETGAWVVQLSAQKTEGEAQSVPRGTGKIFGAGRLLAPGSQEGSVPIRLIQTLTRYRMSHRTEGKSARKHFWTRTD